MPLTGAQINGRPLISLADFQVPAAAATYNAIATLRNTNYGTPLYALVYAIIGPGTSAGTVFTFTMGAGVGGTVNLFASTAVGAVGTATDAFFPITALLDHAQPPGQVINFIVSTATGFTAGSYVRCQLWGFVA